MPNPGRSADACAWTAHQSPGKQATALQLRVRLTPKSSRDGIDGLTETRDGPAVKARVRAVPENGAANKALAAVIAKWLSVPKSNITLSAGARSRTKVLTIIADQIDITRMIEQLEQLTTD